MIKALEQYYGSSNTILTEATAPIMEYSGATSAAGDDPKSTLLDHAVVEQLHSFVEEISSKHNQDNEFHAFNHAVSVLMSTHRLLSFCTPSNNNKNEEDSDKENEQQQSSSFQLDPLARLSLLIGCLIHDVDHKGVPNFCLSKVDPDLHAKYNGRASQEQNSLSVGWDILMRDDFSMLRGAIYTTREELTRFRQLLVRQVVATDIFDTELAKARSERWQEAFGEQRPSENGEDATSIANKQSTAVLELLIQAGDVSHCMQSWNKYIRWNQNLFKEMYNAYKARHLEKDPSEGWYEGEMKFYDGNVIPLATRLEETGVFGSECLKNARHNRAKWETNGKRLVNSMTLKNKGPSSNDASPAEIV